MHNLAAALSMQRMAASLEAGARKGQARRGCKDEATGKGGSTYSTILWTGRLPKQPSVKCKSRGAELLQTTFVHQEIDHVRCSRVGRIEWVVRLRAKREE